MHERALACSNHDLDHTVEKFVELRQQCAFPWLMANVTDPATGESRRAVCPRLGAQQHGDFLGQGRSRFRFEQHGWWAAAPVLTSPHAPLNAGAGEPLGGAQPCVMLEWQGIKVSAAALPGRCCQRACPPAGDSSMEYGAVC
jgi:hypothetical protein